MKHYRVKLTPLTPIHIGTGQELGPLDYVIKDGQFYALQAERMMETMGEEEKSRLLEMIEADDLVGLRKFFRENFREDMAKYKARVMPAMERKYEDSLENVENQLLVQPFIRSGIDGVPYLPGSSLKGALRTGILNALAHKKNVNKEKTTHWDFEFVVLNALNRNGKRDMSKDPFRGICLTDFYGKQEWMATGEVKNVRKNPARNRMEPVSIQMFTEVMLGLANGVEASLQGELRWDDFLFERTGILGTKFSLPEAMRYCREFYKIDLDREKKFYETEAEILKVLEMISEKERKMGEKETLVRVGRFSGVFAVTLEDYRDPRPPRGKKYGKTRNLFDGKYPMGWMRVQVEDV